ncbi:hypothetical protein BBK14_17855 [Parafrankia soli]|uniref:DUF4158 domain-containing protein n=1 Tax=Parafrankia soli TaxID=2599596 RepID=A0A1S1Q8H7_9ACTN|nr:hypothetical protein BBK14_17855 [Parafrankia soli]
MPITGRVEGAAQWGGIWVWTGWWTTSPCPATRLGFAVQLKFLTWRGRFPRMRLELPPDAVEHVAKQVGVAASELGFYDFASRAAKRHRSELRDLTGWHECMKSDLVKLVSHLVDVIWHDERREEQVRAELLRQMRVDLIEPPGPGPGTPRRTTRTRWSRPSRTSRLIRATSATTGTGVCRTSCRHGAGAPCLRSATGERAEERSEPPQRASTRSSPRRGRSDRLLLGHARRREPW